MEPEEYGEGRTARDADIDLTRCPYIGQDIPEVMNGSLKAWVRGWIDRDIEITNELYGATDA